MRSAGGTDPFFRSGVGGGAGLPSGDMGRLSFRQSSGAGDGSGSYRGRIAGTRGHQHYTASGASDVYYHPGDLRGGARVGLMIAQKSHGQRGGTVEHY